MLLVPEPVLEGGYSEFYRFYPSSEDEECDFNWLEVIVGDYAMDVWTWHKREVEKAVEEAKPSLNKIIDRIKGVFK